MRKYTILFVLLFASCKRPYIEPHEICAMSTRTNLLPQEQVANILVTHYQKFILTGNVKTFQRDIMSTLGVCSCRSFDFMTGESSGDLIDYPLEKCNTLTGTDYEFFVKNLKPYYKEIDRYFRKETKY